jgi:hypothetical protein
MISKRFLFTRHSYSCNNSIKTINFYNKLKDPNLTIWGIQRTLEKFFENPKLYNSPYVFVSCLIRTWCSAILLYLPNIDSITLLISPFIKEKHNTLFKGLDIGNNPDNIKNQFNKFNKFLKVAHFYCEKQNINIENKNITIYFHKDFYLTFIIKRDKNNLIVIENNFKNIKNNKPYKYIESNEYPNSNILTDEKIKDDIIFYKKNTNINKFIEWIYLLTKPKKDDDPDNIFNNIKLNNIHCVLHSNIMQEYLKSINTKIYNNSEKNNIFKTNSWSIDIKYLSPMKIMPKSLRVYNGVLPPQIKYDSTCEFLCNNNKTRKCKKYKKDNKL